MAPACGGDHPGSDEPLPVYEPLGVESWTAEGRGGVWVPTIRSWALTRGFALHPGTRNRYEIRYTSTQHRPASRHVNDHGRVSGTHRFTHSRALVRDRASQFTGDFDEVFRTA